MGVFIRVISGVILPVLLFGAGLYFLILLLPSLLQRRGRERGSGGARALTVALAGTLGVGNSAGVAAGIAFGGAGAVFWMWMSAILAMFLKYAEVVLAVRTRRYDAEGRPHGGAPYYMKIAFGKRMGHLIGAVFAALCFLCSITLGGIMQSAAAAEILQAVYSIPPVFTGVFLGVAGALILSLGAVRMEQACTALVPLVCAVFFIASLVAIWLRLDAVPDAFAAIFREAFSWKSGVGGMAGFFTSRAVRYGVARGLVSNEAGCGTAPIAHAAANTSLPAAQGVWGMIEVFVDTILLCTMTALVILTSGAAACEGGGMRFAMEAYRATLGPFAAPLLSISVILFAFATVLCWAHYGAESMRVLTRNRRILRMLPLGVLIACIVGAVAAPQFAWHVTDLVLGVMAILNITALLLMRHDILEETRK